MPEGPTTEGSIVAYLRLNDDDWNATLDRAEARAEELGRVDPDIKVRADTADAMAKLEAVRAAEAQLGGGTGTSVSSDKAANALATAQTRLAAAERTAANAASSQYLAELRLAEVQDKRGRTEYQVAAAEEAVARATRNAEAAELKHMAATTALKDAEQAAARAALENAAAQEAEAGASDTAAAASSNAAGATAQGMQAQTAAIAAVAALIGPLTAAVVGLGGAFVAEGAAGVLAVRGIKEEMTAGTAVGMQYTAGLAQLKTDLDVLESTAARGILDGFEKSIDRVDSKMPFLNGFVNEFAGILGQTGTNLLDGAISGMETLEPLFREGAGILQEWTAEFASWTAAGGLNDFVSYAQENLPRVAVAFESLTSAAVTLGTELGPISTDLLDIVTAASDLINMLNGVNKWMDSIGKSVPILGWLTKTAGDVLNPIQGLSDTIGQLQPQIDQWTGATNLQSSALVAANSAIDTAAISTGTLAGAQSTAMTATNQFAQALAGLGNAALSESQANIAWNQSIANATAAVKANGATLDENTQKGRDNRTALDSVASSAIALISAHAKAGVSAQALTGDMAAARQKFIDTAKAMGDTDAQAGALADAYHLIPSDVTTQYQATGMAAANQQLGDLAKAIAAIPTSITIGAHVQVETQGLPTAGHLAAVSATGGWAGAQYRAAGGSMNYLAGGGHGIWEPQGTDTVPTMLTPGEFVVKEKSASYDPQFLKAYNADPARALAAKQGQGGGSSERPIYADGIGLIGWIREVAGQQARLVFKQDLGSLAQQISGGATV